VNRAEMVAQCAALPDTPHDEHLTVYTDNKCSLQKLQGWIRDPKNMEGDKHEDIVRDIATMVAHRSGKIILRKVPAHCGLKWNEAADKTAKNAAKGGEGKGNRVRGPDRPQKTHVYEPVGGHIVIDQKAHL